jgi:hypothetical protein
MDIDQSTFSGNIPINPIGLCLGTVNQRHELLGERRSFVTAFNAIAALPEFTSMINDDEKPYLPARLSCR